MGTVGRSGPLNEPQPMKFEKDLSVKKGESSQVKEKIHHLTDAISLDRTSTKDLSQAAIKNDTEPQFDALEDLERELDAVLENAAPEPSTKLEKLQDLHDTFNTIDNLLLTKDADSYLECENQLDQWLAEGGSKGVKPSKEGKSNAEIDKLIDGLIKELPEKNQLKALNQLAGNEMLAAKEMFAEADKLMDAPIKNQEPKKGVPRGLEAKRAPMTPEQVAQYQLKRAEDDYKVAVKNYENFTPTDDFSKLQKHDLQKRMVSAESKLNALKQESKINSQIEPALKDESNILAEVDLLYEEILKDVSPQKEAPVERSLPKPLPKRPSIVHSPEQEQGQKQTVEASNKSLTAKIGDLKQQFTRARIQNNLGNIFNRIMGKTGPKITEQRQATTQLRGSREEIISKLNSLNMPNKDIEEVARKMLNTKLDEVDTKIFELENFGTAFEETSLPKDVPRPKQVVTQSLRDLQEERASLSLDAYTLKETFGNVSKSEFEKSIDPDKNLLRDSETIFENIVNNPELSANAKVEELAKLHKIISGRVMELIIAGGKDAVTKELLDLMDKLEAKMK